MNYQTPQIYDISRVNKNKGYVKEFSYSILTLGKVCLCLTGLILSRCEIGNTPLTSRNEHLEV